MSFEALSASANLSAASQVAIRANGLGKHYHIYAKPHDRLLQTIWRGKRQFYRDFQALENINFELARGQTLGVIGRNGAGKSTLLQLICGTLAPTAGTIEVQGRIAALLEFGRDFGVCGHWRIYRAAGQNLLQWHVCAASFCGGGSC